MHASKEQLDAALTRLGEAGHLVDRGSARQAQLAHHSPGHALPA